VRVEGSRCTEVWSDCQVLVECNFVVFDLAYSAEDTFAGRAIDGCRCRAGEGYSNPADCDVVGAK
jgi:hypothetical protein